MAGPGARSKPRETPKAVEARAQYVMLGPSRSLAKLAEFRVRLGFGRSSAGQLRLLERWSADHGWQQFVADTTSERAESLAAEAAEYDAATFALTSRILAERLDPQDALPLDSLLRIRESVRAKAGRGESGVTVNVAIVQQAERLARRLGIDAGELMADAERIAAAVWDEG